MLHNFVEFDDNIISKIISDTTYPYPSLCYNKRPPNDVLAFINKELLPYNKNIEIRFYGECEQWNDMSIFKNLSNLTRFQYNPYTISLLNFAEMLPMLTHLRVGFLGNARFNINALKRLSSLKSLDFNGNIYNCEELQDMLNLESLTLDNFVKLNINGLSNMEKIKQLTLRNGSLFNINKFSLPTKLEFLTLFNVRGFTDDNFFTLPESLVNLSIGRIKKISLLPNFSKCDNLKRISLATMNGIENLSIIKTAKNLEEIAYRKARNYNANDFAFLNEIEHLKIAYLGELSDYKNIKNIFKAKNVDLGDSISSEMLLLERSFL